MTEATLFIATAIIAITQAIKFVFPVVNGAVSILVAAAVGVVVALIDTHIGVTDLTVAQGLLTGLSAAGVVTVAKNV